MSAPIQTVVKNLRNTRDLRAEIGSLAAELAATDQAQGRMLVVDPVIAEATVRQEWQRLLPAFAQQIRARMTLAIERSATWMDKSSQPTHSSLLALDPPNYRYEVLRLLVGASLEGNGPLPEAGVAAQTAGTQVGLVAALGASVTPVRKALAALRDARLIPHLSRPQVAPETLSMAQLSRIGALPQTLRFRFEQGARIKPPAQLLARAEPLLGADGPQSWQLFALSGTPVAQQEVASLDLAGTPRLDLVAHVPRSEKTLDAAVMRLLDDGLEPEPNVLAPAPVVVTLIRAGTRFERDAGPRQVRCAHRCDVFLSLLDMGLPEQARQYAKEVRL
ncbi:MAG: hypothetical protein M0Q42_06405 [Xanthomonadales bacterium]|nr:hypothetical protein [Xanthomonadales bacterium]